MYEHSTETGYDCFCLFTGLKVHFTDPSYDFFKYSGHLRLTVEAYRKRTDSKHFEKLPKKAKRVDLLDYMIASLLRDKIWGVDLILEEDTADEIYLDYMKTMESITYTFREEFLYLLGKANSIKDLFSFTEASDYPLVVHELLNDNITIQTATLLNRMFGFVSRMDATLQDDYLWQRVRLKLTKYEPFLIQKLSPEQYDGLKAIVKAHLS